MELCTHEKAVFFLPVNIVIVWSLAFLATQHTTVCLDGSPRALEEISTRIQTSWKGWISS